MKPFKKALSICFKLLYITGFILLIAPFYAAAQGQGQNQAPTQPQPDFSDPDVVLETLYRTISFDEPGQQDWETFQQLFLEGAQLIPAYSENVQSATYQAYMENFKNMVESGTIKSFTEEEIGRTSDRFGNIMQVFSTYQTHFVNASGEHSARGINSIQLVYNQGRWWVTAIAWDQETPDKAIPEKYLQ